MAHGSAATGRLSLRSTVADRVELTRDDVFALLRPCTDTVDVYDRAVTAADSISVVDMALPALLGAAVDLPALIDQMAGRHGRFALSERLEQASAALRAIPTDTDLWDWPAADLRSALEPVFGRCALPGFGPSHVTKLLHRKRPRLVPIIDEGCIWRIWKDTDVESWTVSDLLDVTESIRAEVSGQRAALSELTVRVGELGGGFRTLSPLRVYDLVVWGLHVAGGAPPATPVSGS